VETHRGFHIQFSDLPFPDNGCPHCGNNTASPLKLRSSEHTIDMWRGKASRRTDASFS
jgi:hypothetical protein